MKRLAVVGALAAALAGCTPGEAEFTLKTSEVRKALNGEVAHIRVHERMTTVLSNAYAKVTFGDGKYTNRLDVVKMLAAQANGCKLLASPTNAVKIWVEEKPGALPCVKLDADLWIALGTKDAFVKQAAARQLDEMYRLVIEPDTGRIRDVTDKDQKELPNERFVAFFSAAMAREELLKSLFGNEAEDLTVADNTLLSAALPTWFKNLSCVVVGDGDEPLYVVAEDAKVNGKPMAKFEGHVKKGETVRFELDKRKHGKDGGMRFFLKKPVEPSL